jgi:signal transduction histidine kinase
MPYQGLTLGSLRILLIEDSAEDAELVSDQLLESGIDACFQRVDNEQALQQALTEFSPDIVLSDLSMPGFCGYRALRVVREHDESMPFVFVSGTIGEEAAVQALQCGASDYIIKHNPTRLPTAVARAVHEARAEIERQRVENELMRVQRLDSMALLAAGLSHDLRNILQPLLIVPSLLLDRSDDPKLRQLANVVAECGRRGHEMAESMLSFVRGSRQSREHVSITGLFQAVELLLRSSVPDGVSLRMILEDDSLCVQANYTELQQCLLNFGLNALQAMPEEGTLTFSASLAVGDNVCMRVVDTGIGMSELTQARLFTPFFTTKSDGTGLGLMSCKRIIQAHGGSINVHSRLGEGTRIELLLPLCVELPQANGDEPAVAPGRGQSVLLVDGEESQLSLLGNALSSQGYRPMLASDGAAALRIVRTQGLPELVLVDSDIALLSAASLLATMCELGYRQAVIVMEAAQAATRREQFPSGIALQVLCKPVEMHQVFRAVAAALEY